MHLRLSLLCAALWAGLAVQAQTCSATSAAQQTTLLELYTSEGCDSCPRADRWLSGVKPSAQVLAAAFHVDYWDRLGWKDRFASAEHTARQVQQQGLSGAGFSYTPQVLSNGRDWRGWPGLPPAPQATARVQIHLQREAADRVSMLATAGPGAPARLGLWWALLEDGHVSQVKAGENRGATLRHDHVVRHYAQLPAWAANTPARLTLLAPRQGEAGRSTRLLVVVTDAATGVPQQAMQLDC